MTISPVAYHPHTSQAVYEEGLLTGLLASMLLGIKSEAGDGGGEWGQ